MRKRDNPALLRTVPHRLHSPSADLPAHRFPTIMQSFEDVVAALRAGAQCTEVLPHLSDLFTSLPPAPPNPSTPSPTSRLFQTLPDGTRVQLPYLRPHFNAWDAVQQLPHHHQPFYDGEMHIDLCSGMRARFLKPPSDDLFRMVARWDTGFREDVATEGSDAEGEELMSVVEKTLGLDDVEAVGHQLIDFFDDGMNNVPELPNLTFDQWAVAFSTQVVDSLSGPKVIALLRGVHHKTLAEFVLFTIVPFLSLQGKHDELLNLVQLAVEKADMATMPVKKVRKLLNVYRGMSGGVTAVMAQLTIANSIRKHI